MVKIERVYRTVPLGEFDRKAGVYPVTWRRPVVAPFSLGIEAVPVDFGFGLVTRRRDDDVIKVVLSLSDRVKLI